ncbi:MAG: ComEA family DNA-binding protein, partial [Shewanella sp.]
SPAPTTDQQAVSDGKININLASLTLLQELPGIGPQKAQAIIDYREQTPFTTIADLQKVSGIGEKTFAKLEQLISVE